MPTGGFVFLGLQFLQFVKDFFQKKRKTICKRNTQQFHRNSRIFFIMNNNIANYANFR